MYVCKLMFSSLPFVLNSYTDPCRLPLLTEIHLRGVGNELRVLHPHPRLNFVQAHARFFVGTAQIRIPYLHY